MPLNRPTRILLLIPLLLLLIAAAFSLVVSVFYADAVKQALVSRINRQLRSEIKVKDFGFSLWRHFPFVAFELNEVMVKDPLASGKSDTLLQARRISLLFDLTGLLRDDITVRKIVADDGSLNIRIDKKGNPNYEIWEADTSGESRNIDLSEIRLNDLRLTYSDQKHHQDYSFITDRLVFSATFRPSGYDLSATGDFRVLRFVSDGTLYIKDQAAVIDASLAADDTKDLYSLGNCSLKLGNVDFHVGGSFTVKEDVKMDLSVNTSRCSLDELMALVPPRYAGFLKDFESEGDIEFHSTLKGISSEKEVPVFSAEFSLSDGKLRPSKQEVALKDINLSGVFQSGKKGQLLVKKLSARLGPHPLTADFRIKDFDDPILDVRAHSAVDLASLKGFLQLDTLESLNGTARVDIDFSGYLRNFRKDVGDAATGIRSSGTVALSDVSFRLKSNPLRFESINGRLTLSDQSIAVRPLTGVISSTDFRIDGTIDNLVGFLLLNDRSASFKADFSSKNIDLDELLLNKSASTSEDTAYKLELSPRLSGELNVNIGNIKFRRFKATGINGNVRLVDQALTGRGLRFSAMHGTVSMDAVINAARKDSVIMSCDAAMNRLDIRELFYQLENFYQDVMTDRNVKGRVTANVQFRSSWTKDLTINPSKARATCDITIENGELNDFTPILPLSKYLKVKDLRNIRFSTLHNVVSISNSLITIPSMEIKSTALDITASGTHDFDNMVDYRIRLYLSDILGKKVRQQSSEFGEIEDDGLGRMQLFLSMKGPVDDPKITYDKKAVKEKLKTDVAREKETIKQIMKQEFGIFKKDTVKKAPAPKKNDEMQIEWAP